LTPQIDSGNGYGVTWGDYDNDGDLDLYLVNHGSANRLYQNNDDGTFTDIGAISGTDDSGLGLGAASGDYDNDGDLDLYVTNTGSENRLYRNDSAVPAGYHWLHVDRVGMTLKIGRGATVSAVPTALVPGHITGSTPATGAYANHFARPQAWTGPALRSPRRRDKDGA